MPNHKPIMEVSFVCGDCSKEATVMSNIVVASRLCVECRKLRGSIRRKNYYAANADAARAYTAKWRKENPERNKEAVERWHKDPANKERIVAYHHEHYLANLDERRKYRKLQYAADPETAKKSVKDWVIAHPERAKERGRIWRQKNPDKMRASTERRRGRYVGHFTDTDIATIMTSQRGKCGNPVCGVDLSNGYHVDHIMPVSKGGTSWPDNIQLLCPPCNLRKSARDPFEWAQSIGRLFV